MGWEQIQTKSEIETGIGRDIEIDIETRKETAMASRAIPFLQLTTALAEKVARNLVKNVCIYRQQVANKSPPFLCDFPK